MAFVILIYINERNSVLLKILIFDRVAGAIIGLRLVASVCPSVCLWALSWLNRLTFDLDFGEVRL